MQTSLNIQDISINRLGEIAKAIAKNINNIDCILLSGDLGAGKTTFSQKLINAIAKLESYPAQDVTSPTFNIIHEYDIALKKIWHVDLYRIENIVDIADIGLDDALDSRICIIEWPEIYQDFYPKAQLSIKITNTNNDSNERNINISATGAWKNRLDKIEQELKF